MSNYSFKYRDAICICALALWANLDASNSSPSTKISCIGHPLDFWLDGGVVDSLKDNKFLSCKPEFDDVGNAIVYEILNIGCVGCFGHENQSQGGNQIV